MKKLLVLGVLAIAGVLGTSGKASAWCWGCYTPCNWARWCGPAACYPGGYYYPVYYPWYMYYNYYYSPYAPFVYQNYFFGLAANPDTGLSPSVGLPTGGLTRTAPAAATVVANLPADAELLFNGVQATGGGATRTFQTGALNANQDYAYELTARVVRDGKVQTVTEKVIVKAGQETKVSFKLPAAEAVTTASATAAK